jgi:hypothetical protein
VSRLRENALRLISRIMAIWRSVLSWMHWSQRREQRQRELLKVLLLEERARAYHDLEWTLALQEAKFRELLLQALRPVAEAMHRQDNLAELRQDSLAELLVEILQSLQPSAEAQIYPQIGLLPQTSSYPSLVS